MPIIKCTLIQYLCTQMYVSYSSKLNYKKENAIHVRYPYRSLFVFTKGDFTA